MQLIRSILRSQKGGVAILIAMGFMLFSVPIITGSLDIADSTNIDARVKTDILHGNYCGLAVQEYVDYLVVDSQRFETWMDDNQDPEDSGQAIATTDICGESITITVSQQPDLPDDSTDDPLGDPPVIIPQISAYNQRSFQTFKSVSEMNPTPGDSVRYTITVVNRDSTDTTLTSIDDTLPIGFSYYCNNPQPDMLTLPGSGAQIIVPNGDLCPDGDDDGDNDDGGGGGGGGSCVADLNCIGKADVVLVLDNSWSINASELDLLKDAAKVLVDSFYLNEIDGAIVGVSRFSYWSASVHEMSDDAASVKTAIDGLVAGGFDLGFFTNIVAGIEGGQAQFTTGQGDRVDPNVMIFITDGDDTTGHSDTEIATAAAATGAEIFAIGVGNNVSQSTLDAIATNPTNTFSADNFDDLIDLIEDLTTPDPIVWSMPPGTSVPAGGIVTLTFEAITSVNPGTYCNEIQVTPGGSKTRSGKTAIVEIGDGGTGLCSGEAVVVSKTVDDVALVSTETSTDPYTYTFDVEYTITVDNIGSEDLTIAGFIDLLPPGFSYFLTEPIDGDIHDAPSQLHYVSQVDRQRVTWNFNPDVLVASGTAKTLKYRATAVVTRGHYWSDLLVDFGGGSFPEDRYTWPTALISVKDVYDVTATDADGNQLFVTLQMWVEDEIGVINSWDIR